MARTAHMLKYAILDQMTEMASGVLQWLDWNELEC